jgi:probable F420-dependent oxidoreductase
MDIGTLAPLADIGGDPETVTRYAQELEGMGIDYLTAPDHVLGVNAASRPGWEGDTNEDLFHDPFVLFGFLSAATTTLGFATGVLILPQRQTALVAKQAASVDALSRGRLRLGVGLGWNEAEYVGLGEDFHNRGVRSEEQLDVMFRLWADEYVEFEGRWHEIPDAGINPRPQSGRIPLYLGGEHERTLHRVAKWADGWIPNTYPPGDDALAVFAHVRGLAAEYGRDPASIGIEVWTSMGRGGPADWAAEAEFWARAGVTHLTVTTAFEWRHHHRIRGTRADDHLEALSAYSDAVRSVTA